MNRKNHFTLIELLISMALTTLILTTLMFFYKQISYLNTKFDEAQKESFELRFLESRLSYILPRTAYERTVKHDFYFFTEPDYHSVFKNNSQSLIFTFDNGINHDKSFSNHVLGRLYLDRSGNLTLGMWPSPARWSNDELPPMKKEILMENVRSLSFQFFIPQERIQSPVANESKNEKVEPAPRLSWINKWQQNYKQLPAIVRVEITRADHKKHTYAFPLPNVAIPIVYKE